MGLETDWDNLMGDQAGPDHLRDKQLALLMEHIRQQRAVTQEVRDALHHLPGQISTAVEQGLRKVVTDEEVGRRFWEHGYRNLADHATNNINQWVGKRVLMILIAAALSASIGWAVLTGKIK